MSGILYLTANDFVIKRHDKGNLLCLNCEVQNLALVLFYSKECPHCKALLVSYKQLPSIINGCQFTMIDVNRADNKKIIQMGNSTIAPIKYVPDIILYVNGVPYVRYDGDHNIQNIKTFILDIYQRLQKTQFVDSSESGAVRPNAYQQSAAPGKMNGGAAQEQKAPEIPAYTIGRPKCGGSDRDDVCYTTFLSAYAPPPQTG